MKSKTVLIKLVLVTLLFSTIYLNTKAADKPRKPKTSYVGFRGMDTLPKKGVLMSYPTNFVASTMKLGYEFKIAHNKGLKFLASVGSSKGANDWYMLDQFTEYGIEAQLKFYISKSRPSLNGLYMAPYISYKTITYSGNTYDGLVLPINGYYLNATTSNLGLGYIIGYQWLFNSNLAIDAFVGGGDNIISGKNGGGTLATDIFAYRNGIAIRAGIGLGFSF